MKIEMKIEGLQITREIIETRRNQRFSLIRVGNQVNVSSSLDYFIAVSCEDSQQRSKRKRRVLHMRVGADEAMNQRGYWMKVPKYFLAEVKAQVRQMHAQNELAFYEYVGGGYRQRGEPEKRRDNLRYHDPERWARLVAVW